MRVLCSASLPCWEVRRIHALTQAASQMTFLEWAALKDTAWRWWWWLGGWWWPLRCSSCGPPVCASRATESLLLQGVGATTRLLQAQPFTEPWVEPAAESSPRTILIVIFARSDDFTATERQLSSLFALLPFSPGITLSQSNTCILLSHTFEGIIYINTKVSATPRKCQICCLSYCCCFFPTHLITVISILFVLKKIYNNGNIKHNVNRVSRDRNMVLCKMWSRNVIGPHFHSVFTLQNSSSHLYLVVVFVGFFLFFFFSLFFCTHIVLLHGVWISHSFFHLYGIWFRLFYWFLSVVIWINDDHI